MLEIDWSAPKPDPQEWAVKLYPELQVTRHQIEHPAITAVLDMVNRTHSNGGALFACFDIAPHPVLTWYGSYGRLDEIDFVDQFVALPAIAQAWPEMFAKYRLQKRVLEATNRPVSLQRLDPFTFDGAIANLVYRGGADGQFTTTPAQAKQMGVAFSNALFEDRYDEVFIWHSYELWTTWFLGIGNGTYSFWDVTYFGLDKRHSTVWLLCVTDSDCRRRS